MRSCCESPSSLGSPRCPSLILASTRPVTAGSSRDCPRCTRRTMSTRSCPRTSLRTKAAAPAMIAANNAYLALINDDTKVIPGHGGLAKKADVVQFRDMLVTARDRIEKLVNEGKTEQEVIDAKPLADLDATWSNNEQHARDYTKMVYNSFKRSLRNQDRPHPEARRKARSEG